MLVGADKKDRKRNLNLKTRPLRSLTIAFTDKHGNIITT